MLIGRFSSAGQLLHGRFFKFCADESTTNDDVRVSTTDYSYEVVVEIYVGGRQLGMLVRDR